MLGLPVAAGSKHRLSDDRVVIDAIVGDVDGKNVIVARRRDRQRRHDRRGAAAGFASGGCKRIAVACTHGLFTGTAIERLRAQPDIEEIVTTDTVPLPAEKRLPNMTVLSIAPLLAEAIRRIHLGKSVSRLFDGTG